MMRTPWRERAVLLGTVAALATGCGSARRSEPLIGEVVVPDSTTALGQRVFDFNCSQCHPAGEAGLGPALNDKPLPGSLVRFQVRNGLGSMPSFGEEEISDAELDAVADYVTWLRDQPST